MRALWNGHLLADSVQTHEVDGYHYFPRASVRMDLLKVAPRTPGDRQCPHGVQFYDANDGRQRSERCAWSYEAPSAAMKKVGHWIAFWDEV
ncbi:MAG: DUF427 domain-containing protein, partial [Planctomycetota bacterium]